MWTVLVQVSHWVCDDYLLRVLPHSPGVTVRYSAYYGQGSGPIWLDNVHCTGRETNILECRANPIGVHNCGHHRDVGILCPSKLQ